MLRFGKKMHMGENGSLLFKMARFELYYIWKGMEKGLSFKNIYPYSGSNFISLPLVSFTLTKHNTIFSAQQPLYILLIIVHTCKLGISNGYHTYSLMLQEKLLF